MDYPYSCIFILYKNKLMKIFFLLFTTLNIITACSQSSKKTSISENAFPQSWDPEKKLKDCKILAWVHMKDDNRLVPFQYKRCICLQTKVDSLDNTIYIIQEMVANEKPYTNWEPAQGRTHGPPMLWKSFHHKPTKTDIDKLFMDEWHFSFYETDYETLSANIDEKLWLKIFGFAPKDSEWAVKK